MDKGKTYKPFELSGKNHTCIRNIDKDIFKKVCKFCGDNIIMRRSNKDGFYKWYTYNSDNLSFHTCLVDGGCEMV